MRPPGWAARTSIVEMLDNECACMAQEAAGSGQGQAFSGQAFSGCSAPDSFHTMAKPGSISAIAPEAESIALAKKIRVLIVEDEALIALVLAEILEEMGFDVCASEATEAGAVAAASRHRPDLMIVDAWLREGNGIAAVATILRDQFIPHVFVSGDRLATAGLHPRAIVLQKPFLVAELALAIQRALGPQPT